MSCMKHVHDNTSRVSRRARLLLGFTLLICTASAEDELDVLGVLGGTMSQEYFGRAMAGTGDINGDGLCDFVVGDARPEVTPGTRRALVWLGSPTLASSPSVYLHQPEPDSSVPGSERDSFFGWNVAGEGDVNGDGFNDIGISAPWWNFGLGKLYIYHGYFNLDAAPDVGIDGPGCSGSELRSELIADINNDGYDETVCLVDGGLDDGAYLYFGGSPMDSLFDIVFQGPGTPGQFLGSDVAHGDVNGDNYVDIVVGSFGASHIDYRSDAAWVYFGGAVFDTIPDLRLRPEEFCVGFDVCIPGDFNGDSYDDVVVSFGYYVYPEGHYGTRVFFGGASMDSCSDLTFERSFLDGPWARLTGGDVNNDEFADLVVGELSNDEAQGKVSVYFGSSEMDTIPDIVITAEGAFGEALAWMGDLTGDGYAEFAVANPTARSGYGEITLYTMGDVWASETPNPLPVTALRLAPNPARTSLSIILPFDPDRDARLEVYDAVGHRVRQFKRLTALSLWDLRSDAGGTVPSGVYIIRLDGIGLGISRPVLVCR